MVRVQLVRKVADYLDGIDVSQYKVGDVFDVHPLEASLLIAEGWAIGVYLPRASLDRRTGTDRHDPFLADGEMSSGNGSKK